jgi:hypothetical protein
VTSERATITGPQAYPTVRMHTVGRHSMPSIYGSKRWRTPLPSLRNEKVRGSDLVSFGGSARLSAALTAHDHANIDQGHHCEQHQRDYEGWRRPEHGKPD